MTPWEGKLWHMFLKNYPTKMYRQRVINNFIADFYCSKAKLIIELDGSGHYTPEQLEYDKQRTLELKKFGVDVLRFSNFDIDKNFYGVCTKIDETIKDKIKSQQQIQEEIL